MRGRLDKEVEDRFQCKNHKKNSKARGMCLCADFAITFNSLPHGSVIDKRKEKIRNSI